MTYGTNKMFPPRGTDIVKGLTQAPRFLGLKDRNFSLPRYGCCHCDYRLDKTLEIPNAMCQKTTGKAALGVEGVTDPSQVDRPSLSESGSL